MDNRDDVTDSKRKQGSTSHHVAVASTQGAESVARNRRGGEGLGSDRACHVVRVRAKPTIGVHAESRRTVGIGRVGQARGCGETWRRSGGRREAWWSSNIAAEARHCGSGRDGRCRANTGRLPCADTQRILGEAESNAALYAIMQRKAVKVIQRLGGKGDIFKFDEAHGSILLGPETESLVSTLFGKHGLELVLGRIDREIAHIQSIAWWVLIGRVDRGVVVPGKLLCVLLISGVWPVGAHRRRNRVR